MEQKSVSIVLCTFNGEKYLRQQLDTLLWVIAGALLLITGFYSKMIRSPRDSWQYLSKLYSAHLYVE